VRGLGEVSRALKEKKTGGNSVAMEEVEEGAVQDECWPLNARCLEHGIASERIVARTWDSVLATGTFLEMGTRSFGIGCRSNVVNLWDQGGGNADMQVLV
jgi:hypothetical protein